MNICVTDHALERYRERVYDKAERHDVAKAVKASVIVEGAMQRRLAKCGFSFDNRREGFYMYDSFTQTIFVLAKAKRKGKSKGKAFSLITCYQAKK